MDRHIARKVEAKLLAIVLVQVGISPQAVEERRLEEGGQPRIRFRGLVKQGQVGRMGGLARQGEDLSFRGVHKTAQIVFPKFHHRIGVVGREAFEQLGP